MNNGIVVLLLIILCVWGVPLWKQFWGDVSVIPDFPDNWPEDQYKHLARELWSEKYEREKRDNAVRWPLVGAFLAWTWFVAHYPY
jgi:hypothetical protein